MLKTSDCRVLGCVLIRKPEPSSRPQAQWEVSHSRLFHTSAPVNTASVIRHAQRAAKRPSLVAKPLTDESSEDELVTVIARPKRKVALRKSARFEVSDSEPSLLAPDNVTDSETYGGSTSESEGSFGRYF